MNFCFSVMQVSFQCVVICSGRLRWCGVRRSGMLRSVPSSPASVIVKTISFYICYHVVYVNGWGVTHKLKTFIILSYFLVFVKAIRDNFMEIMEFQCEDKRVSLEFCSILQLYFQLMLLVWIVINCRNVFISFQLNI